MTQLTDEQAERLKQIRKNRRFYGGMGELTSDFDFLLEIVSPLLDSDSQAACKLEFEAKLLGFPNEEDRIKLCETCLRQAIADNFVIFSSGIPRQMQQPDAATRMRDLCVAKVRDYRLKCEQTGVQLADKEDEGSQRMYWRADGAADALEIMEGELSSLTLDQEQEKQW